MFIACSNDDAQSGDNFPKDIPFTNILKGATNENSGISKSIIIIKNINELQSLLNKLEYSNNNGIDYGSIDFDKFYLMAVILEIKGNGWEVEVTNIKEFKENVKVSIKDTPFMSAVITQPFHIVKIPKIDKDFIFDE